LFDQETPKLREKCRVFYTKYYNLLTATALLLFLVGFGFRMQPSFRHSYGRVILSCSNVLWYMKVLEYLSVHPLLGPYIQMAAKMVISMCYIIVLLLVTLMAFGVSRQAITYPHEKWNWLLVRNIFYKPYFMLYGEVYAGEIDTCGDEGTNCVPGGWIPPVLMTIFLLVANILLINMLIAIFNNIFNDTNIRSHEVWLFQRYGQVMEYNDTPLLPPPFTILAYMARLLCFFSEKKPLKNGKEREDVVVKCSMSKFVFFS
ncbi:Transporter cation channel family protein, partial [Trichostrongylus colubriformis]